MLSSLYTRITAILKSPNFWKPNRLFTKSRVRSIWWQCGKCYQVQKTWGTNRVRISHFVRQVQGIIDEEPSKSIRAISRDLQISESNSVTLSTKTSGSLTWYAKVSLCRHKLKNSDSSGQRLLNKLKHPEIPDMLWFYSDEKNFDQDKKINRRNDRWLCADYSDVPYVMHIT